MCAEVYKHQHIETGGNLFGLWTTSGSAVIHVLLGPGKNCKRTTASFHQDIEYMHRVGRFVNDNYMLCHIGEWHSHHSLSLNRPSDGDVQTVRRNFPEGVAKFLVIIANIINTDTIAVSPYFFIDGGQRYELAEFVVLKSDSPFSADAKIMEQIQLGAEGGKEFQQNETRQGGASATTIENTRDTHSNSKPSVHACPSYSQAVSRGSAEKSNNAGLNSRRDNELSSTRSQATSPNSQPTRRNANGGTSMDTLDVESQGCGPNRPAHSQTTDDSPKHGTVQNQTASSEGEMASTKEIILKKIKDELEKYFGEEGNIDMERTNNGVIQMTFKHRLYYWRLSFPQNFPKQPAQLVSAYSLRSLSIMSPRPDNSLTNYVDILLSVKKQCYTSTCNICKSISRESLTEPCIASPEPASAMPAGNTSLKDAVAALKNELVITGIVTPLSFFAEPQNDQSYKIKFQHHLRNWLITFPPEFPDKPAEVYQKEDGYRTVSKKVRYFSNTKHEEVALVSSDLIVLAIYKNCDCLKCRSKKR